MNTTLGIPDCIPIHVLHSTLIANKQVSLQTIGCHDECISISLVSKSIQDYKCMVIVPGIRQISSIRCDVSMVILKTSNSDVEIFLIVKNPKFRGLRARSIIIPGRFEVNLRQALLGSTPYHLSHRLFWALHPHRLLENWVYPDTFLCFERVFPKALLKIVIPLQSMCGQPKSLHM